MGLKFLKTKFFWGGATPPISPDIVCPRFASTLYKANLMLDELPLIFTKFFSIELIFLGF
jgi:hypothetical protein